METARVKEPHPQNGTRPSRRRVASDAPLETAKAYVALTEGKEYEFGGQTSKRTSGSERTGRWAALAGMIALVVGLASSEVLKNLVMQPRPFLSPSPANITSKAIQTSP